MQKVHLLFLIIFFMAGCATPPPETPLTNLEIRPHLERISLEHMQLFTVTKRCAGLGGETKSAMLDIESKWLAENSRFLQKVNGYYKEVVMPESIVQKGNNISLKTVYWVNNALEAIEDDLSFMRYSNANRNRRCEQLANELYSTATTRSFAEDHPQAYKQIMDFERAETASATELPLLPLPARDYSINKDGQRSVYTVEKLLSEDNCNLKVILPLILDWPEEIYAGYCSDATEKVVNCNWGHCKISQ